MITVKDLLQVKGEDVWAVSPEISTIEALNLMAEKNIGALMVVEGDHLVGIISERDFVRRVASERDCQLNTLVKDYMTTQVYTVRPEQTITEVMKLMSGQHIRHLPVIEDQHLVGLISIGDVVKGIISEQDSTIHSLENYILGTGYGQ